MPAVTRTKLRRLTPETLSILEKKRDAARDSGDPSMSGASTKMCLKARSKADLEQYYNNLADEVEEGLKHNNISSVFRSVQATAGSPTQSH